jgi:hypothetical protein
MYRLISKAFFVRDGEDVEGNFQFFNIYLWLALDAVGVDV